MRFILAMLMVLGFWSPAAAETVKSDGMTFELELPNGYCALSRENMGKSPLYAQQDRLNAKTNTVMGISVPCGEVEQIRKGANPVRWVIWLMIGAPGEPFIVPPGLDRKQTIAELAKAMPALDWKEVMGNVGKNTRKEGIELKPSYSGAIDQDEAAVYMGLLVRVTGGDVKREIAGVSGLTQMHTRVFSINSYADFESRQTFDTLLADVKETLSRAISKTDAQPADKSLPPGMQKH